MSSHNDYSDQDLEKFIDYYNEQLEIVKKVDKKIAELKSKKKSKKEEIELAELQEQLLRDIEDLKTYKEDADKAEDILKRRRFIAGKQSTSLSRDRKLYITLARRYLSKGLSDKEIKTVESLINACTTKEKMKSVYNQYRNIALSKAPSTQALTAEEIDQRENPLEEVIPVIQAFARAKLSHGKHPSVLQKPPKHVSRPSTSREVQGAQTQTSQTQTLVPLNAFKFIEKGNKRFLEPMTPEKAEELAIKKKTIQSETILNPDRFKRKPHVWYSRAR